MSRSINRRGFTLIELLVVIAIIAILAAILFPVFAQAREKARAISCLSNEKQVGTAIYMYEQDYDEKAPGGLNGYGGGSGYAGQIYPYVKNTQAFKCPDDPSGGTYRSSSLAMNANTSVTSPICISQNYAGCCLLTADSLSLASYSAPASSVLLFEVINSTYYYIDTEIQPAPVGTASYCGGSPSGSGLGGQYEPNGYNGPSDPNGGTPTDGHTKYATGILNGITMNTGSFFAVDGRHSMGANYIMADTHAKFFRPRAISPGYNAGAETNNQIDNSTAAGTAGLFSDGVGRPAATFSVK